MMGFNQSLTGELPSQKAQWFFRYKIYHIPFWFVYHYLWWTVNIGSAWWAAHNIFNSVYVVKYCFYVIIQAIGVYFNLYFLIPRLLEKRHYLKYTVSLFTTMIAMAFLIIPGYYLTAWISPQTFQELFNQKPQNWMYFFQINTFPSAVAAMTFGMSLKLAKSWLQSKQREQALEKEKTEAELKFLKSQFNPHFLFNTINSIFVLINKDPRMASESLAKFSDILRYQLYECNEQQIPLEQELNYITNYIELQKLRHDQDNARLVITLEAPSTSNLVIAPFILMPFIENAFKHVSRKSDGKNWISMKVSVIGDRLLADISNSRSHATQSSMGYIQHGGLGLKNVQRRLELLYRGKHLLSITERDGEYIVQMTLSLHERFANVDLETAPRNLSA